MFLFSLDVIIVLFKEMTIAGQKIKEHKTEMKHSELAFKFLSEGEGLLEGEDAIRRVRSFIKLLRRLLRAWLRSMLPISTKRQRVKDDGLFDYWKRQLTHWQVN